MILLPYELSVSNHFFSPRRIFVRLEPENINDIDDGANAVREIAYALAAAVLATGFVKKDPAVAVTATLYNATYYSNNNGSPAEDWHHAGYSRIAAPAYMPLIRRGIVSLDDVAANANAYWPSPETPPPERFKVLELDVDSAVRDFRRAVRDEENRSPPGTGSAAVQANWNAWCCRFFDPAAKHILARLNEYEGKARIIPV